MARTKVQLIGNVSTGASFTGIITAPTLSVGSAVTITSSGINVTGVITASSFVGDGSGLTGVGIGSTGSVNTTGIVTASSFVGDGSTLTGVGIGSTGSVNTTGIVTASTVSANEFIGSGDKLIFSPTPTQFTPISGATGVGLNTSITITFDQLIYAGVGTITLRNSSGIGTIIQSIGVGSTSVNVSGQTITITPTSNLPLNTNVYVVLPQGVLKNAIGGNIATLSTYNFTTLDFTLQSINPANNATNVGIDTNITLTFNNPPTKGTGTIEIRQGSTSGALIESFNVSTSSSITTSGNDFIINPTNNLGYSTSFHTIIPSTAITNYVGLNTTGADSHKFTTRGPNLGESYEGGILICQSGGVRWIAAPNSSEVTRNWYSRDDASTRAQQVSGCTGWFIPTCAQLSNPVGPCRTYWFPTNCPQARFWSSTESAFMSSTFAFYVNMSGGSFNVNSYCKNCAICARSFRCVTY